jgi:hypothetical protein
MMAEEVTVSDQINWLKLDLEVNEVYCDLRIRFLHTAERFYKIASIATGSAAGAALIALFTQHLPPVTSAWIGASFALTFAVLAHVRESLEITLNIYKYNLLKKKSLELLREVKSKANATANDLVKFTDIQKTIASEEPPVYVAVYFLARNQIVRKYGLDDAGRAQIPLWRRLFAHYLYQSNYEPTLSFAVERGSSATRERHAT